MSPSRFSRLSVGAARLSELPQVLGLLDECKLPAAGVTDHLDGFLVARDDRALAGVVGVERYGEIGLVRSLAVRPDARGRGLGAKLVQAIIGEARRRGIDTLYLLTETAEGFFPRFGFERVRRESLDPKLRASHELRGACPETAIAMRLRI